MRLRHGLFALLHAGVPGYALGLVDGQDCCRKQHHETAAGVQQDHRAPFRHSIPFPKTELQNPVKSNPVRRLLLALGLALAAPLPGTKVFTVNLNAIVAGAVTGDYAYLPGSPSPGELSISRT